MSNRRTNWLRRKPMMWEKYILPELQGKSPIRIVEIGVFEGLSAGWWLSRLLTGPDDFFLGIDSWEPALMHGFAMEEAYESARRTIEPYGDKAMLYRGTSESAFRQNEDTLRGILEPESFDIAYIDGDHSAAGAMLDAVNCWSVIRPGGMVLLDDWKSHRRRGQIDLCESLRNFFVAIKGRYEVVWEDVQFCVRKLRT